MSRLAYIFLYASHALANWREIGQHRKMPRRFIQRYMPDHQMIRDHRHLKFLGTLLHDRNLWHLNRHSVAGACFVGLFVAFIPIPFQMVLAALFAIAFQVHLPISVGLVWVTNPFTMPPIFYFAYRLGCWIISQPVGDFHVELSIDWLMTGLVDVWQPLFVGSSVLAFISAVLGYAGMRLFWRGVVIWKWRKRHATSPSD